MSDYTCDDIAALETMLESKQDQLAIYQLELEDLQADLAGLQEDLTVARNLLSQFEDNLKNQKTLLNEKIVEKQQVELQIIQIRQYIAFLQLKLLNLQNEKSDLLAYVQGQPEIITAWCADYTLNLTGEVGIADVPGAAGLDFQGVTYYSPAVVRQIRPGFSGRASYNSARDGILQHAKASAPANHFLQAVRHSAVMKWKPQYRYGKITAINYGNNTCSVSLSAASDRYMFDSYNVNQSSELSGIQIEYMDCHAAAFAEGDDVIVEWASGTAKVVGFKENPKPCKSKMFAVCQWHFPDSGVSVNNIIFDLDKKKVVKSMMGFSFPLQVPDLHNHSDPFFVFVQNNALCFISDDMQADYVGQYPENFDDYAYWSTSSSPNVIPAWVIQGSTDYNPVPPLLCDWSVSGFICPHPENPDQIYGIHNYIYCLQRDSDGYSEHYGWVADEMLSFDIQYNINGILNHNIEQWVHDKIVESYAGVPPVKIWLHTGIRSYFSMLYFQDGINMADIEYWEL